MNFSSFLEDAIGNHVFQNAPYAQPTQLLLALFTVTPNNDGTGGTEVSGGDYAREDVTATGWTSTNGEISNDAEIAFNQATAPWGTVVGAAIYDQTGTNMLYYGDLNTPKAVDLGDTARFPAGTFKIQHA